MENTIKQKTNLIFILSLVLAILVIFIIYFLGKKQDEQFLYASQQYIMSSQLIGSKEGDVPSNLKKSIEILENLKKDQTSSVTIARNLGLAYALLGDFNSATLEYKRAVQLRPFLTIEPRFMLQFGEILYFNDNLEEAKVVLDKAKAIPGVEGDETYLSRIDELLNSISEMDVGGQE